MFVGAAAAETAKKVAVVPFTVHAEKDLTFLQQGVVDMLTSRLSEEGKVTVLGRDETAAALAGVEGPLNPEKATQLGRKLGADYVLYGSLTVFGDSVSVDAKMVDVSGAAQPISFFTQSQSLGEVIPAIDRFSAQINQKVFGRTVSQPAAVATAPAPQPVQPQAAGPDIHEHPEKLIAGGFGEAGQRQGMGQGGISLTRPWKSRSFNKLINGIDLGDVDADGKMETVIATPDKVLIYRFEKQRFFQVGEIAIPGSRYPVGVDIADINGNGIPEIFVSALNGAKNGASSVVFEYAGGEYKTVVTDAPYYFRVSDRTGAMGPRLYGQRQSLGKDPFAEPIDQMVWEAGDYVSAGRTLPGKKANALGFAVGDPMQNGGEQILIYNREDYLTLLDPSSGDVIWKSGSRLGGSTLALTLGTGGRGDTDNRSYLPMRIRALDLDKEPGSEVIVAENHEVTGRLLEQFRVFNKTELHILSWDGIGLGPIWKTRSISGYIRDFAVGDFDGDGTKELVAALVSEEGRIAFTEAKSAIIAFDILVTPKKGAGEK